MHIHERWIHKFQIKENSWVYVPTEAAKEFGETVKETIESKWKAPKIYYHLSSGGHVKALNQHIQNNYFLHLDIKDFFGNITRNRVTRCLRRFYPTHADARDVATESTVHLPNSDPVKHILPFGFVQSPILASICLKQSALGKLLEQISKESDFELSVYMDDIIVSSNNLDSLKTVFPRIEAASIRSKLPLNADKQEGPGEIVTAFNVRLTHNLLELTDERMKQFEEVYNNSTNEAQKNGILSYLASINLTQHDILHNT